MAISFDGKVVLVTGAGRGLGRAYATLLARLGAGVVVNDAGVSLAGSGGGAGPALSVVEEIVASGGRAVANVDTVATAGGARQMVQQAVAVLGGLDAVVCNAGTMSPEARFGEQPDDELERMLAVHVWGAWHVLRAAWPIFERQAYGRVVLVSSGASLWGATGVAAYATAKAAVVGLMNALTAEGEPKGILVNTVVPRAFTRLFEAERDLSETEREWARRGARPADVAAVVAYLASSECSASGAIVRATTTRFNRVDIALSPGIAPPASDERDADWVASHWPEITELGGAVSASSGLFRK